MVVLRKDKEYFIKKFVFNLRSNLNSGDSREKIEKHIILFSRTILRHWRTLNNF